MPTIQCHRLGHATLWTPDLDRMIAYYTEVIGLQLIEREAGRAFLATREGLEAICLEKGETPELARIAFQVAPGSDLKDLAGALQKAGITAERRRGISPGIADAIAFTDPKGTLIEVYANYEFAKEDKGDQGISPVKFGHLAYRVNDPKKITDFYCDVLGFRVSDWMGDHFSFLRCGADHHTINFARYDEEKLHHIAFELRDWGAIHDACDYLTKKDIQLVWGPLRHVVGHNIAAYHRNPDEIRVELFAEMDLMKDEELGYWEPRPWHEETPLRPKVWGK